MKKPAGLILVASLLFLVGLRSLTAGAEATLSVKSIQSAIGLISIAAAYGLWTGRGYAMKAYWLWVGTWLVGGGIVQVVADDVAISHVVIWWLFVGAVWLLVGIYLRGALRQAA